jgi:hypothetical protein
MRLALLGTSARGDETLRCELRPGWCPVVGHSVVVSGAAGRVGSWGFPLELRWCASFRRGKRSIMPSSKRPVMMPSSPRGSSPSRVCRRAGRRGALGVSEVDSGNTAAPAAERAETPSPGRDDSVRRPSAGRSAARSSSPTYHKPHNRLRKAATTATRTVSTRGGRDPN